MACGKTLGTLSAFKRVTVLSTSTYQFFPTTDWMPLTGLEVRAWLNMLDESSDGVEAIPAYQTATVVTDQKSTNGGRGDWAAISGTAITTEAIHAFGDISGLPTDKQWIRFGIAAKKGAGSSFGQADISAMFQVKPCGKVVGDVNVAGVEADATREIPVSDWFASVDTSTVRIGYLLDADANFNIEWYIQTADDTNRPGQPAAISGASTVSGLGAGNYNPGNTGDLSISSVLTPGTASSTPAWARIMARISTSGGAVSADQIVVNVQVK